MGIQLNNKKTKAKPVDKNAIIKAKDAVINALDQNGNGTIDIEDIIVLAIKTPGVQIVRANFLKKNFSKIIRKRLLTRQSRLLLPRLGFHRMKLTKLRMKLSNLNATVCQVFLLH